MKKIICLLLMVCCIFVGCGKNEDISNSSSNSEKESESSEIKENEGGDSVDTILSFSDENMDKIITTPTFDISQYTADASNNIKTYELFASGMCLQRDAINRIWGKASSTNNIAAEINGNVYYGSVKSREWEIYLPKMQAGGPYELTIISEMGRLTLTDIYIGEVFLLSGQSNMEWQPQHSGEVLKDMYATSDCENNQIRMLQMGWSTPTEPTNEAIRYSQWKWANQSTIPNFTAVGYLFGKQMQEELGCPVGLIANPVGGSSIEFWLSQENYDKVQESYNSYTTNETYMTPCLGYNGMLYPLTGLNVRGVLWYQGESNAFGTQQYYDIALQIFMSQCREMFNNEQLSFTICQLARYEGNPYAYSIVNERINHVALNDPYVIVARNLDLGDWFNIHPADKYEIGRRAAYETLRVFFKKDKPAPIEVVDYTFNMDGSVTIDLSRDAKLVNGTNGFEVYVDGKYTYACNVNVQGNQLTVTADGEITKLRYGYTCKMTEEVKNDVSKMVTVYDDNGFPLDLFLIAKQNSADESVTMVTPSLTAGYYDSGYMITSNEENDEYIITKYASAVQWEGAMLDVMDYSSSYSSFVIKFTTTNVRNFSIELIVSGGDPDWAENISVYQTMIEDGLHEVYIDFSTVQPISTTNWDYVSGYYIKYYQIVAVKIVLDTAVGSADDLIKEDATCIIHEFTFKVK